METFLMALGGCTGMDVVPILRKMRAPLESLTIHITANQRAEHPRVFTNVHVRFIATGSGLRPEQVKKAVKLSEEKYCSISAMLSKTATLSFEVVVEPTAPTRERTA